MVLMSARAASVRSAEVAIVRAAAVVQGLALVTVPTLSTVLTDPARFALSQTAYGALFVPQSVLAIVFSLAGGRLTRRFGLKRVLLVGLAADAVSMGLLAASARLGTSHAFAYAALLCATACLGFGFAIVTPALNVLAGGFEPRNVDRAVLIVNALLGAAAALAPVLLVVFVGLGFWWGLPLLAGSAMAVLFALAQRLPFDVAQRAAAGSRLRIPARFWVFAAFALTYGFCEQMIGSWAPLYVTDQLGAAAAFGSLALTLFWGCIAAARVGFALSSRQLAATTVFRVLPFVLAAAFALLARTPAHASPLAAAGAFALAGLGASALLPLVISFCERSIPEEATAVTSFVFAIYLIGYGLAAYGAGPLQRFGFSLRDSYEACIVLSLAVGALAFGIVAVLNRSPHSLEPAGEHA
jgi:MFS family permease